MSSLKAKQDERLKRINAELARFNLRPLKHLGNFKNQEFELIEVSAMWPNRWYVLVQFECIRPDGETGCYIMKFDTDGKDRRGCLIIPMIHDTRSGKSWIGFIRQHRPTMLVREKEYWTLELPRMWATFQMPPPLLVAPHDPEEATDTRPERVAESELVPLLKEKRIKLEKPVALSIGDAEDTGMSACFSDIWLMRATTSGFEEIKDSLETNGIAALRFYELDDVRKRRKELGLNDRHTKAALLDLYEHLDKAA